MNEKSIFPAVIPPRVHDDVKPIKPGKTIAVIWDSPQCVHFSMRKSPISDATKERIAQGVKKYLENSPAPWSIKLSVNH